MEVRIFIYISIFSVLIPLSLAIVQWKRMPREIAMLRWLLVAGLILDVIQRTLGILKQHNEWPGDIFMFIQFTLLLYIFSLQFERKIIFKVIYSVVVAFCVMSLLFVDGAAALIRSSAIDGIVLIIVSIAFFYKLLNELKVANIHRLPVLWIAFATLFYYSGNFFVFLARSYLEKDLDALLFFWIWVHNSLNIIKNILFAIALWQSYRAVRTPNG
jgi:hypothetical protein